MKVVERYGVARTLLVFADTMYEDEDTYAWGRAAAKVVGAELAEISDGRTPWEVFRDERYLGNSRADPCSKILKRQLIDRWLASNFDPSEVTLHFGIHWSESDRFFRVDRDGEFRGVLLRMFEAGWFARALLCEKPYMGMDEIREWASRCGLWEQRLYRAGFPHANCGGRCVKQGQSGWTLLYHKFPERFAECEREENKMREMLGDVAMLKETVKGESRPLPLAVLRQRIEAKQAMPLFDFGGCGCFAGDNT